MNKVYFIFCLLLQTPLLRAKEIKLNCSQKLFSKKECESLNDKIANYCYEEVVASIKNYGLSLSLVNIESVNLKITDLIASWLVKESSDEWILSSSDKLIIIFNANGITYSTVASFYVNESKQDLLDHLANSIRYSTAQVTLDEERERKKIYAAIAQMKIEYLIESSKLKQRMGLGSSLEDITAFENTLESKELLKKVSMKFLGYDSEEEALSKHRSKFNRLKYEFIKSELNEIENGYCETKTSILDTIQTKESKINNSSRGKIKEHSFESNRQSETKVLRGVNAK